MVSQKYIKLRKMIKNEVSRWLVMEIKGKECFRMSYFFDIWSPMASTSAEISQSCTSRVVIFGRVFRSSIFAIFSGFFSRLTRSPTVFPTGSFGLDLKKGKNTSLKIKRIEMSKATSDKNSFQDR